jgi:hypothetical protein
MSNRIAHKELDIQRHRSMYGASLGGCDMHNDCPSHPQIRRQALLALSSRKVNDATSLLIRASALLEQGMQDRASALIAEAQRPARHASRLLKSAAALSRKPRGAMRADILDRAGKGTTA